jgi:hypothetical protein
MAADLPLFILDFVVVGILTAALLMVRRMVSAQAFKDVLGISATFVVLSGIGFLMIVGEHALG